MAEESENDSPPDSDEPTETDIDFRSGYQSIGTGCYRALAVRYE